MSKIDFSSGSNADFHSSVKRHTKHLLVAHGTEAGKWPEEVTDVKNSFVRALDAALSSTSGLPKVRLSLSDTASLDDHGHPIRSFDEAEDLSDPEFACDLLLFPDAIRIKHVRKSKVEEFAQALKNYCQQQSAAKSNSSSSSSSLSFPLPSTPLSGVHFLVCAHKLRDKRCGVSGPILCEEIDKQIALAYPSSPLPTPVHTYKISHIGGHKYAGNVICYPGGVWYGRVLPCHVPHLLVAHVEGFAAVDQSSGERKAVTDETTREEELRKLKPLVRGRVDPL